MKQTKKSLKQLYRTHGALTFLLAFSPMLPKVVETHTKGYLALTRRLTGSVENMDEAIKILFGERGLKTYRQYRQKHPQQILPNDVFESLYQKNDTDEGLKLIQKMFFDRKQREFVHSDKIRASIIMATTDILRVFPENDYQKFRSKFIRLLANQAIIDQALTSQLSFIEIALRLLTQRQRHITHTHQERLQTIFAGIEAKIKAELAGKSSAFTAPPRTFNSKEKNPIVISESEAHNLHEVLLLLAVSPSAEIRDKAKQTILEIESLKKESSND